MNRIDQRHAGLADRVDPAYAIEALGEVIELLDKAKMWRRVQEFFWAKKNSGMTNERIEIARVVLAEKVEELRRAGRSAPDADR